MQKELMKTPQHMLELGLAALSHANWHSSFSSFENDKWSELSVLQAAHAAEILIKARIAQEHPLLIFDKIPKSTQVGSDLLTFQDLVKNARTIQYSDLPERLWAATGIKLNNLEIFKSFGELRNTIQHFTVPEEWETNTVDFIFKVIDPFINECWELFAVDYHEDSEPYQYMVDSLISNEILFLVSPECAVDLKPFDFDWPVNETYKNEMLKRFDAAFKAAIENKEGK